MKRRYMFLVSLMLAFSFSSCTKDYQSLFLTGDGSFEQLVPFENSQVVGSDGGVVVGGGEDSPQGKKTFIQIPEGALATDTVISLRSVDPAEEGISRYGSQDNYFVEFGPHGTVFEKPAIVSIPYRPVENAAGQRLFYYNADKTTWEEVPILALDEENRVVLAEITHFSIYTVDSTNMLLDIELYRNNSDNLYGAVKLMTPWDQIDLGGDGMMSELMAAQPVDVRAAYRVTLKRELGHGMPAWLIGLLDTINPVIATRTIYYRVDQVLGSVYSVEAEDESASVLLNTMSRGIELDFAGVERYYSGEPLLFDFGISAVDDRQYYLTVDLYYLKNGATLDTMTADDIWGSQGYTVVAYTGAQMLPAMPPVTDVDANGDGIVDHSGDGYAYDQLPVVAITSPPDGGAFLEGTPISFSATATDLEDGPIPGSALGWSSDRDGPVGTGETIDVDTLSLGTHVITCTATDSVGNLGTGTVTVIVSADPPVVTSVIPVDGATGIPVASSIYARFNKEIDPASVTDATFLVRDGDGTPVAGLVSYDSLVATFTPVPALRYNTQYTVTMTTGVRDNNGTPLAGEVSWSFRTRSNEVQLEPAAYEHHGAAYFGGPTRRLARTSGEDLQVGVDFTYGDDILDIYDMSVGGAFADGRYLRIVEDTVNIGDLAGLGLTPVAMDMESWVAPHSDECFVDPAKSKFTLPRPSYWSRMENWDGTLVSPEVGEGTPSTAQDITDTYAGINSTANHYEDFVEGSGLGQALHNYWYAQGGYVGAWGQSVGSRYLYPFGEGVTRDVSRGTLSFYGKIDTLKTLDAFGVCGGNSRVEWRMISDILQVRIYNVNTDGVDTGMQAEIWMFNGTDMVKIAGPVNFGPINTWYHIYIEWDIDESMENRSVVVHANNSEILYTTMDLPGTLRHAQDPYIQAYGYTYAWGATVEWVSLVGAIRAESFLDNVKWFNHVVKSGGEPAGPGWDYARLMAGHDNAVHAVYGSSGDYRPILDGGTSGVGYFYNPVMPGVGEAPSAPANLREKTTGSSTGHLTWDASVDPDGTVIGYDIYMSLTSGSGYAKIGTSYVNEFAVDTLSPFTPTYFMIRAVDDTGIESGESNELMVNIEPEMQVLWGNSDVPDGGEMTFMTMLRARNRKSLVIKNLGDINLELTGMPPVEITGTDASSFSVVYEPATVITPSGSTVFTVEFRPLTGGAKTATLTIPNTDADKGGYSITLTGNSYYGRMDIGLYNPNSPTIFFPGGDFILKFLAPDGSFYKNVRYQWESRPGAQALAGDFNCDGRADLCLYGGDRFLIRFGYGENSFGTQRTYVWRSGGRAFTGDFNFDGYYDLGLYNVNGDGRARIRYGDGNGGFSGETVYNWGSFPSAQVVAGDFNGDGHFDLCLYNAEGGGDFRIRYGDSTGSFGGETIEARWDIWPDANNTEGYYYQGWNPPFAYYHSYHEYSRVFSGDFNGDGIWDIGIYYVNKLTGFGSRILIDSLRSGCVVTRYGNGDGSFSDFKYNRLINDYSLALRLVGDYYEENFVNKLYSEFWIFAYLDYSYNYYPGLVLKGKPISGNFDWQ